MKWHCLNDTNRYCTKEPSFNIVSQSVTSEAGVNYMAGGTCKLSPDSCDNCKTSQELYDELPQAEKDRISNPVCIITQTTANAEQPNKEVAKGKTKAAKKLEKEIIQGTMF